MAAKIQIRIPCKAHELELRLHAFCDHYGMDADVTIETAEENGEAVQALVITEAECR